MCKYLHSDGPQSANNFADCEIIKRYKTIRNRLQSRALATHKTAVDLEDDGKWLSWPTFREAIVQLQLDFDLTGEELTAKNARLLHDLVLMRLFEASPRCAPHIVFSSCLYCRF